MIKAIIFDIDGTLVYTKYEYIINTVKNTVADLGKQTRQQAITARPPSVASYDGLLERVEENDIIKFWFGMDRDAIVSSWGLKPKDFWRSFRIHDNPHIRKDFIIAYDDIHVLKKLKEQDIKLAALSNAPPWIVAINVGKIPVDFDCIVNTYGGIVRPKPDPHGIEECMRLMGTEKEETIMVGNGLEDHLAAKAAGIRDFFIDRNEHKIEVPSESRISSLTELLAILGENKAY